MQRSLVSMENKDHIHWSNDCPHYRIPANPTSTTICLSVCVWRSAQPANTAQRQWPLSRKPSSLPSLTFCSRMCRVSVLRGFPARVVYLYYISCLRYTLLVGNPWLVNTLAVDLSVKLSAELSWQILLLVFCNSCYFHAYFPFQFVPNWVTVFLCFEMWVECMQKFVYVYALKPFVWCSDSRVLCQAWGYCMWPLLHYCAHGNTFSWYPLFSQSFAMGVTEFLAV